MSRASRMQEPRSLSVLVGDPCWDGSSLPGERSRTACQALAKAHPTLSACPRGNSGRARWIGVLAASLTFFVVLVASTEFASAVVDVLIAAVALSLIYRFDLMRRAGRGDFAIDVADDVARSQADSDLPLYTILVPAFREANVLPVVIDGIRSLDYPPEQLEVLLLLEEDDNETIRAARAHCDADSRFRIVVVPNSRPRTKAKACNYGLLEARGDYIAIYDAEDTPEPLQLRRAVTAFRTCPPSVACLQAKLSYCNAHQNVLTRWFTIEYDTWFHWLLPGLVSAGAPIPLGGTSNHIRRDVLLDLGAWDPYNVTEDADLGIRMARCGWRVAVLSSTTLEEANSDAINWIKQRSRWYKGYLQTFLVHLREPRSLARELGWRGLAGFVLFVGGTPLLALVSPVFWTMSALWFLASPGYIAALLSPFGYYAGMVAWIAGGCALIYSGIAICRVVDKPELCWPALFMPLYWVLMSLAAVKAAVQLVANPSYWEKTEHGLDETVPERSEGDQR